MRSPLGALANRITAPRPAPGPTNAAPVPYASRGQTRVGSWIRPAGTESHLRAMGSVGTLFAIVDRLATSTAAVDWALYRTSKPGQRTDGEPVEVTAHAAADLWEHPNDHFTRQLLVETVQQHLDLVGEGWMVISRSARASLPLELWPVPPHRMEPVPSRDDYVAGYLYTSPDGERIPLGLDDVIFMRRPNPADPYRGIGAVQTIRADLEGVRMSAEWNRNFFANSAEPGGIVEVDRRLSDDEFDELTARWREQHQGVANAHRVAVLEQAKWVDRKYSMRDMQFAELRGVASDVIREAFGIPKFTLGDIDDVNRATAEASKAWFAEQMTLPRLERFKQALNSKLLPLYGPTGQGVEFGYCNPVPIDREADDRERESKANAFATLVTAGVDPDDAADAAGLPRMRVEIRQPASAPAAAPGEQPAARRARPAATADQLLAHLAGAATDSDGGSGLGEVQQSWTRALADLLARWASIVSGWIAKLVALVRDLVGSGDLAGLPGMDLDTEHAADIVADAMTDLAANAADQIVADAARDGVRITEGTADADVLAQVAQAVARLLASRLEDSAAAEALRVTIPGRASTNEADRVADLVQQHLIGLSDADARYQIGAALTAAQHAGRLATFLAAEADGQAPAGGYWASEELDGATCSPCREIDGTRLGDRAEATLAAYPVLGYIGCLGRARCRGMVVAHWTEDE